MTSRRAIELCLSAGLIISAPGSGLAAEKITTGPPKLEVEAGAREGPSWDPAGYVYFVGGTRVMRRDMQGKVEVFRDDAPGENGSLVDPQRRVLVCEASGRRVTRTEKDGTLTFSPTTTKAGSSTHRTTSRSIPRDGSISLTRDTGERTRWRFAMRQAS